MNGSLQRRLLLWLSSAIVLAGAATGALAFWLAIADANDLQDRQMQQVATLLASRASLPEAGPEPANADEEDVETHFVIRRLGAPQTSSDPQFDLPLPEELPDGLQSRETRGVQWRVIVSRNARGQRFAVAQRQTVRDEIARNTALFGLLPVLVLVPVLLVIVRLALRRSFAPWQALSGQVDRLDGRRLSDLDPSGVPSETLPLVHAFNGLIARLAAVLEQQRRMVADAAHELRTPLAATQLQADNLGHAALTDDARARLDTLQRGLARISALVEQLLGLARVQGQTEFVFTRIALASAVHSVIEEILPMAEARGVDLGCVKLQPVDVLGDALRVHALVRNVIDNAVRYTPRGGSVDVSVGVEGSNACLVVEDTGPGIEPAKRERVFEPFFRILGSQEPGSGLGLAIVRGAAQALGGCVELGDRPDGRPGLRVTYRQAIA